MGAVRVKTTVLAIGRRDAGELRGLARRLVVIALDHAEIAGARALGLGIDGALDGIFHIGRGDGAAVVEFQIGPELEGIGQPVVGDGVALRQIGHQLGRAGLVVHQPAEDALDDRPVLPVIADGRIEGREVVLEGDHRGTALLGRGIGEGRRQYQRPGQGHGGKGRPLQASHDFNLPVVAWLSASHRNRMRGSIRGVTRSARRLPSTMATAATRVTPMMMGISMRWIACQASWPMPGQP